MIFADLINNDIVDSDNGLCVSLWFGYCDIRCPGCHNKQLWDSNEHKPNQEVIQNILKILDESPVDLSLSILGGEPLSDKNRNDCAEIIEEIRKRKPDLYIRCWTGRTWGTVLRESKKDQSISSILKNINQIITGPFKESLKCTDALIGSSNQEIKNKGIDF